MFKASIVGKEFENSNKTVKMRPQWRNSAAYEMVLTFYGWD